LELCDNFDVVCLRTFDNASENSADG